jgi:uncharacterized Zn finger protein
MAAFSRTWWGQRFIAALEQFTVPARLGRGRAYASSGRILEYKLADAGRVTARVRGSINPYFGVYKEPIYRTSVALSPISRAEWTKVIGVIASKAGFVTRLLMNEMPDDIEAAFADATRRLLPERPDEFTTDCSCPDYFNPCKHIAGLTYCLASDLDRDPFLLFELRGLGRQQLRTELERSPLGRILAAELEPHPAPVTPAAAYFTRPSRAAAPATPSYKEFWAGARRPPAPGEAAPRASVPALLVKKGGDYPPFWPKNASFIGTMQELYERVRSKQRQLQ